MIESILLHVGGVRAMLRVQEFCTRLADMPASSVCYPQGLSVFSLPGIREHSLLVNSIRALPGTLPLAELMHQVQEQVEAARDAKVLCLSSASLVQFPEALIKLKAYLKVLCPQAKQEVLLTLAPQEEEFLAHFYANTLGGGCYPWHVWLQQEYQFSPGYDLNIQHMRELFGAEATHVLIDSDDTPFYDALGLKLQSLLQCDIPPHAPEEQSIVSLLLPPQVCHFWRTVSALRQLIKDDAHTIDYFAQLENLQRLPAANGDVLPYSVRTEIRKRYKESNVNSAQLLGVDQLFASDLCSEVAEFCGLDEETALQVASNIKPDARRDLLRLFDQLPVVYQTYSMRVCHNALKKADGISHIEVGYGTAKVSVVTLTYNHAKFIGKNIQSVIAQKTNFPVQHIIADDASTDGTQEIILEYARKYPHIVPVFQQKRSMCSGNNVSALFSLARSPYVAPCEGDDFFSDPCKLQIQADFLDKTPDCDLCFHPVQVIYEDGSNRKRMYPPCEALPRGVKEFYYLADLLKSNLMQTNSVMYRWRFQSGVPLWFRADLIPGDWYWHLLHAENSRIGFINKCMAVYRRHLKSLYYSSETEGTSVPHRVLHGMRELEMYSVVNRHFKDRYKNTLTSLACSVFADLLHYQLQSGDSKLLIESLERYPEFGMYFLKQIRIQRKTVAPEASN